MISFYPLLPWWVVLLMGGVAVWLVWRAAQRGNDLDRKRRRQLAGLRLAAVALVVLMLLCPGMVIREVDRQHNNVVFLLDGSGSMKTCDLPGGVSRFDAAVKVLENLNRHGVASCQTVNFLFNNDASVISDFDTLKNFGADGGTDLGRAFQSVDRKLGLNSVAAAVVLTDGIDNAGFTGLHTGVPLFAVRFGTELETIPDLRIEAFKLPDNARIGEELEISIPLLLTGRPDTVETTLAVLVDGRPALTQKVKLEPGKPVTVKFHHTFTTDGIHIVKLDCGRIDGEATYLNNTRELAVEVREGSSETLCFFPTLNSTFRPLLRLLKETGSKFTAACRLGDRQWQIIGSADAQVLRHGLPRSGELLRHYDVIILGAGGNGLTRTEENELEQYAANGGNLIVLGGPDAYTASVLTAALPVKITRSAYLAGDFRVVPPEVGDSQFAAAIAELCGSSAAVLRGINTVDGVRGNAEVLLRAENEDGRRPLVVAASYGRGRVVAVLTSSLHLWGSGTARQHNYGTFWKQLLSYAGKSREEQLTFSVNHTELVPGDTLEVKAMLNLAGDHRPAQLEALLYPYGSNEAVAALPMTASGSLYSAVFSHLARGRYLLQVNCRADGKPLATRYKLILCGDRIQENYELKSTVENFTRFTTAGRVYAPEETDRLLRDLVNTVEKNDVLREWFPVFSTPAFLLMLLVLLGTEWYLRRRYNLF